MPHLPPHLASSYPYDGAAGGSVTGGGVGAAIGAGARDISGAPETGCAVNVLAMERLGKNLMSLSQVQRGVKGRGFVVQRCWARACGVG